MILKTKKLHASRTTRRTAPPEPIAAEPPIRKGFGDTDVPFPYLERAEEPIKAHSRPTKDDVLVAELAATQPKVDAARVEFYRRSFTADAKVNRILVLRLDEATSRRADGAKYAIWDGHHKAAGAKAAGRETMRALVIDDYTLPLVGDMGES